MRVFGGNSGLKVQVDAGVYRLSGLIDEQANFDAIVPIDGVIKLDLREVESISSIGIRRWVRFVERQQKGSLRLVACPPPIVSMLNAVPSALSAKPAEQVLSVLVPFTCKACNFYHEVEVSVPSLVANQQLAVPDHICASCGHPTRIVTDIDEYLYFLVADD